MKRVTIILCALLCMASRHPDRMIRADLALNASFNRGDASDRSMYAATPTLAGNATAASRALVLDGSGDWLSYPDAASLDMTGDMSLSIWVKRNGSPSANEAVAGKYAAAAGWLLIITTDGKIHFDGRTSGGSFVAGPVSSASICNNAWRHVCAVRSGTSWILYIDGTAVTPVANGSHSFANSQPLSFGAYDAGAGFVSPLTGSLDDCRLYNRALTANEVGAVTSSGRD